MTAQNETEPTIEAIADLKPSGPAAAAFVASGIGSLVLGIFVTLNEIGSHDSATGNTGSLMAQLNNFLRFDANYGLGTGVGPLSGKVILAVVAFLVSWAVLALLWRGREISIRKAFIATLALVGLGFALTFPPIFYILAGE